MTGHFTDHRDGREDRTYCGKDALKVRYATDLAGPALYLAEWLGAYQIAPCKKCVTQAGVIQRGYSPLIEAA